MSKNWSRMWIGLLVIAVLCILATTLLADGAVDAAGPHSPGPADRQPTCYTIDTSRPEWLQAPVSIYLPLITKQHAP
jgi:hypothetical protein